MPIAYNGHTDRITFKAKNEHLRGPEIFWKKYFSIQNLMSFHSIWACGCSWGIADKLEIKNDQLPYFPTKINN